MAVAAIRKSFSRKSRNKASAQSQGSARPDSLTCLVHFLDASQASFSIEKRSRPSDLLDDVCSLLSLQEKDYFGFSYTNETGFQCWLHDYKSIHKQMPGDPPYSLRFAVKFYVPDPTQLREDVTRYQFCLQIRTDLYLGRLCVDPETLAEMAALSLQAELGDHDESILPDGYERQYEFVPNQDELNIYEKIVDLHKQQDGLLPFESELRILNLARNAEGYGKLTFDCTGADGSSVQLGACHRGLEVKPEGTEARMYTWPEITKMLYKRKRFIIKTLPAEGPPQFLPFLFNHRRAAKEVWKVIQEQHDFFRLEFALQPSKLQFLKLGSKFRYSGRTQYQIKRMEDFSIRPGITINRLGSLRRSGGRGAPLPVRPSSSASNHRTDVTLTVMSRSNTLPGRVDRTTEGTSIQVNIEDVLRHRQLANGSQGGSSRDMSINEDKASMLVHVSTPATSLHNLNSTVPTYSSVSIPGGEDDLEPDYQELNGVTKANTQEKTNSESGGSEALTTNGEAKSETGGDKTGEAAASGDQSGEGGNANGTASVVRALMEGSTATNEEVNKPSGERKTSESAVPVYEEIPAIHFQSSEGRVRSGTTSLLHSPQTSSSSLPMFQIRKSASAVELGHNQTQPGYKIHRAGSMTGSEHSVISADVHELMEELGIADPIEEEDRSSCGRNSHTKTDEDGDEASNRSEEENGDDDNDQGAPDNFEVDPFAQPGASQYAVGAFGVTTVAAPTSF